MKKNNVLTRITSLLMAAALAVSVICTVPLPTQAASASVWYKVHVEDIGWMNPVCNSATAGTEGRSKAIEAIQIDLGLSGISGGVLYRVHVKDHSWLPWQTNKMTAGTTGERRRAEAIQIKLTGAIANSYDIVYRTHVQNVGWMSWVSNGATSGTTGRSLRMEAIQIKLVPKAGSADAALNWCASKVGKTVGNGQCVGLIAAYYQYNGVSAVSGNAKDYATNALPSGWSRVKGGTPQPGDILVYTGAKYGHVAIYAGSNTIYHQNWNGKYVEKTTGWSYNKSWYSKAEGGTKSYWGYIRPRFK